MLIRILRVNKHFYRSSRRLPAEPHDNLSIHQCSQPRIALRLPHILESTSELALRQSADASKSYPLLQFIDLRSFMIQTGLDQGEDRSLGSTR